MRTGILVVVLSDLTESYRQKIRGAASIYRHEEIYDDAGAS